MSWHPRVLTPRWLAPIRRWLASALRLLRATLRWLTATPRRRRNLILSLTALLAPVWAASSVSAQPPDEMIVAEPVPAGILDRIMTGRPAGYVGGLDISSHDHGKFDVHWPTEVAAGSQFVYIKATEATTYVNPHFKSDYAAAKAAHRYVGAYVYARPDRGDPVAQADFFLTHAQFAKDERTLVPFVDLEWPYKGVPVGACYNLTTDQMRTWIHAFLDRIESAIGRKPMIYTNTNWWNPCTGNDASFADYPLDIAGYTKKPPPLPAGWTKFTLWQYTPGNSERRSDHDRDVVAGGMPGLKALTWPARAKVGAAAAKTIPAENG
jgi:GH25 family lysozyme M1 (1,4-beta-N-acetylmuramidase)